MKVFYTSFLPLSFSNWFCTFNNLSLFPFEKKLLAQILYSKLLIPFSLWQKKSRILVMLLQLVVSSLYRSPSVWNTLLEIWNFLQRNSTITSSTFWVMPKLWTTRVSESGSFWFSPPAFSPLFVTFFVFFLVRKKRPSASTNPTTHWSVGSFLFQAGETYVPFAWGVYDLDLVKISFFSAWVNSVFSSVSKAFTHCKK